MSMYDLISTHLENNVQYRDQSSRVEAANTNNNTIVQQLINLSAMNSEKLTGNRQKKDERQKNVETTLTSS